jgi:outer membrane protein assembly factor BamD (BamD/ComL family)
MLKQVLKSSRKSVIMRPFNCITEFVQNYPSSKYLKEAEEIKKSSEKAIIDVRKLIAHSNCRNESTGRKNQSCRRKQKRRH